MAVIRKWYPNAPNYVSYKRSNWALDPYTLGSYSFVKAGANGEECESYQEHESTNHKVFFAGEGVSCDFIATVHGAYLTGIEAAKSAINPLSSAFNPFTAIFSLFLGVATLSLF